MSADRLFQIVSIAGFAALAGALAAHYFRIVRPSLATAPAAEGDPSIRRYGLLERVVLIGLGASLAVLAVTGFAPALLGRRLEGVLLMVHVPAGGAMAFFAAVAAALWAGDCRFAAHDGHWWRRCCCRQTVAAGRFDGPQKAAFWAVLALSLPVTLTMMLSMVPAFGPEGLETLHEFHRYGALLLTMVVLVHWHHAITVRRGSLHALVAGKVARAWAERYHSLWAAGRADR